MLNRRKALKNIGIGSFTGASLFNISKWSAPVIVLQILPSHAQATPDPTTTIENRECDGVDNTASICLNSAVPVQDGATKGDLRYNGQSNYSFFLDRLTNNCLAPNETVNATVEYTIEARSNRGIESVDEGLRNVPLVPDTSESFSINFSGVVSPVTEITFVEFTLTAKFSTDNSQVSIIDTITDTTRINIVNSVIDGVSVIEAQITKQC